MTALKGSPATKALAVRVYAHCKAFGWNVRLGEVAKALGVPIGTLSGCMRKQGWSDRFKTVQSRSRLDNGNYVNPTPKYIDRDGAKHFLGINLDSHDD
jgi:hypothetical protein